MAESAADLRVPATVMAVEGQRVRVLADPQGGCQACAEGRGCGGGVLGKLIASRRRPLEVGITDFPVREKQRVWLVMDAQLLSRLALWTWGMPVAALVIAAMVGEQLPAPGGWIVGAMIFAAGLVAPRVASRHLSLRSLRIEPQFPGGEGVSGCVSALG